MEHFELTENYHQLHGMLRGYDLTNETSFSPTSAPIIEPSNSVNNYDNEDRNFLGVYLILPFCFSIASGSLSGYIRHINPEVYDSLKFQVVSKGVMLFGAVAASITSLYSGGNRVSTDSHLSAVAWILASAPTVFYTAEKVAAHILANKAHEL